MDDKILLVQTLGSELHLKYIPNLWQLSNSVTLLFQCLIKLVRAGLQ